MTNIDIVNGLVFQALRINKETFDERLVSQKKVFLLQEMGVDIGYSYNWYVRGPYSPDLATYIFSNLDVLKEQDFSKYHLTESVQKNIDAVNNLDLGIEKDKIIYDMNKKLEQHNKYIINVGEDLPEIKNWKF